jgi:tripartite-type tricarboxylate transporter receptor subunit TctC
MNEYSNSRSKEVKSVSLCARWEATRSLTHVLALGMGAALVSSCLGSAPSFAQQWPQQPVKIVVSAAAGGPIDVFGRIVAENLSQSLGQNVLIENVPGAGGGTGGQRVARSAPDGHTLLLGTSATHTFSQVLYAQPLYDAKAEFEPIALLAEIPLVLIVRKDMPVSNLSEFAAYAKANAGKMNYGSAGAGSSTHLGCALLTNAIGANVTHVPYRGTGPAMQDLQAGRIDFLCEIVVTALPQVEGGTVKAIATMATDRSPVLPKVPTTVEGGLPAVQAYSFTALFAPKGTPASILTLLSSSADAVMSAPTVRTRLEQLGATIAKPERRTPRYLEKYVADEIEKWASIVKASGIPLQ